MSNTATEVFLPQIMKDGFKLFESLDKDVRLAQIDKIHYIDTIARQLEKNISSVDLFKIFSNENNVLTCTEAEINKTLVNFNSADYVDDREIQRLSTSQKENIVKASNYWNNGRRRDLERMISGHNSNIRRYQTEVDTQLSQRNRSRELLNQLSDDDGTILQKQIETILDTKKYKLARIDQDKIVFEMLDDVINTFKNERAGIDLRVNLGTFKLVIYWDGMNTKLEPLSNNIPCGSYIHPHYNSGTPCLGNLTEVMQEAQTEQDLVKIIEINESLLLNYCDENPYQNLSEFAKASQQVQSNGERVDSEETNQNHHESGRYHIISCGECDEDIEIQIENAGQFSYECHECGHYDENNYDSYFG